MKGEVKRTTLKTCITSIINGRRGEGEGPSTKERDKHVSVANLLRILVFEEDARMSSDDDIMFATKICVSHYQIVVPKLQMSPGVYVHSM